MENTTMTMHAVACVLSARPRLAGTVLLADIRFEARGTTVSIAARQGLRLAAFGAPVSGVTTADAKTYPTTDVVRSRSGRPPV